MKIFWRGSELTWLTLVLQLRQDRVHFDPLQQCHPYALSGRLDPKVQRFFVSLNALAHSFPGRAYAITMKNKWVAGILFTITAGELILGLHVIIWAALNPRKYPCSIAYSRVLELRRGIQCQLRPRLFYLCFKGVFPTSRGPSQPFRSSSLSSLVSTCYSSHSPIPRADPPTCSFRTPRFHPRARTSPTHKIEVQRGEFPEDSR